MDPQFHKVVLDTVTTLTGNYERIICMSDGCLTECRVRQKWMGDDEWSDIIFRFSKKHPFDTEDGAPE